MTRMHYPGPLALPRVVVVGRREVETDADGCVEVPDHVAESLLDQGWLIHEDVDQTNEDEGAQ